MAACTKHIKLLWKGAFCTLYLLFSVCIPQTAHAEWVDLGTLTPDRELFPLDPECQYRVKFFRVHHQPPYPDSFGEKVFSVQDFSTHGAVEGAEIRSQVLWSPVRLADVKAWANWGIYKEGQTFQGEPIEDDDRIVEAFANDHTFGDNRLVLSVGPGRDNRVSWSYQFFNRQYNIFMTSGPSLKGEYFSLEENCPKAEPAEIVSANASSEYSSYYGIGNTYDDDVNTYWIGGSGAGTYQLDYELSRVVSLTSLDINWYHESYAASNFDVLISEDGENYTIAAGGLNAVRNVSLNGESAKHIRIVMHSVNNTSFAVIREFSFTSE